MADAQAQADARTSPSPAAHHVVVLLPAEPGDVTTAAGGALAEPCSTEPRPVVPAKRGADADAEATSSAGADDPGGGSTEPKRPAPAFTRTSFLRPTSSDAWFLSNSHRRNFASRKLGRDLLRGTSSKKISQRLGPLDVSVLPELARKATCDGIGYPTRTPHARIALSMLRDPRQVDAWIAELLSGFHVMLYGVGDKALIVRDIVERAAPRHGGAAVVLQGAAGRALAPEKILESIEHALAVPPGDADTEPAAGRPSRIWQRVSRIAQYLASASLEPQARRLFVGLLAFDHAVFHTARMHILLHALARCERIHLVASVSHVNAGLLFDGPAGSFGLGAAGHAEMRLPRQPYLRRVRAPWLWHAASTYVPPVAELVQARGAGAGTPVLTGLAALKLPAAVDLAGGRARTAPSASAAAVMAQPISQTAAIQVLSTITQRARTLFTQLAAMQLVATSAAAPAADGEEPEIPRTPYAALVREALREFVASSDEGVRHLLGEMVDHGLVVVVRGASTVSSSHAMAVGDEVLIPLPVSALEDVLTQLS